MELTLYHYWRSSSSWRVRWALIEKNIPHKTESINLLESEQISKEHLEKHPGGFVPVLEISNKDRPFYLIESTAIVEWLEENFPQKPLLPKDSVLKAQCRALCQIINAEIQPLQNFAVLNELKTQKVDHLEWMQKWIKKGLKTYEAVCQSVSGKFSVGDNLSLADLFLMPQLYNAHRFGIKFDDLPNLVKIEANCHQLSSYQTSHPDMFQP